MLKKITNELYFSIFPNKHSLFAFILIIIIILIFNMSIYHVINTYKNKYQQEKLFENMEMLNFVLEEKKDSLSRYAVAISRFRGLLNLEDDNLLKRRLVNLEKGIKVYNTNLDVIYNTGSNFELEKDDVLAESIIQVIQEGYNVSFFSENDYFELQINAISPIFDEYSIDISGLLIVSDVITKEYLQTIAKNIDGIIQFFKNDEFADNENDEFVEAKYFPGKGYYIKEERINHTNYLIAYLPVKDFYSNIIGYLTILKPQENSYSVIYNIVILGFIYTMILVYFVSKIYLNNQHKLKR